MKDTRLFWDWFAANQDRYRNINSLDMEVVSGLFDELVRELQQYSEGLYAEIGGKEEPYELIITPQGNKSFFSAAEYLVMQAPALPGWQLMALKPAHGTNFSFSMGDMVLSADTIFFSPLEDGEDPDAIGVCIYHKDYQTEDSDKQGALINGLYYCLDSVLGEKAVTLDINFMEFDRLPEDAGALNLLPIGDLKGYIEWRKKERSSYEVRYPGETATLLEGKANDLPILVMVNRNYKYYNYTAEYPWLLTFTLQYEPGDNGLPAEAMEPIYEIEDNIVGQIGEQGHYLASETHNGNRRIYCYMSSRAHAESLAKAADHVTSHRIRTDIVYDKYWVAIDNYL